MINFRFSESNRAVDIYLYEFNSFNKFETFVDHIFRVKKDGKKVYVCFNAYRGELDYQKGEQDVYTIMITCQPYLEIAAMEMKRLKDFLKTNHKFDYTIFEYNTYNEAFDFCKDLMQGITSLN